MQWPRRLLQGAARRRFGRRLGLSLLAAALGVVQVEATSRETASHDEADPAPRHSLAGRVLDSEGRPVPNATLSFFPHCLEVGEAVGDAGGSGASSVSSAAGFMIGTAAGGDYDIALPEGIWRVVVEADGFDAAVSDEITLLEPVRLPTARLRQAEAGRAEDEDPTAFALLAAGDFWKAYSRRGAAPGEIIRETTEEAKSLEISGRVLSSASRRPLPGALVWGEAETTCIAEAGPEGVYRFDLSATRGDVPWQARAAAPGHLEAALAFHPRNAQRLTLVLERAPGRVSGRVLDRRGRPLSDVTVVAAERRRFSRITATDFRGIFDLHRLPVDRPIELTATAPGFLPTTAKIPALGADGWIDDVEVVLRRGLIVRGKLVDGRTSAPVSGAEVHLAAHRDGPPIQVSVSGEDGIFHFRNVPRERLGLEIRAPGYAWAWRVLQIETQEVLDVGEVELAEGLDLEGRIVDGDGQGVVGARLFLDRTPDSFSLTLSGKPSGRPTTISQERGEFSLGGLEWDERVALWVDAAGYQLKRLDFHPEDWVSPRLIALDRSSQLCGTVSDSAARLIVGARLFQTYVNALQMELQETTTGAKGRFCFEIRPEAVQLSAIAEGHHGLQISISDIESPVHEVELQLSEEGVVEGKILRSDGEPVDGARLEAVGPESRADPSSIAGSMILPLAVSDGEGRFRLENVAPGPNLIEVKKDGDQVSRLVEVDPGVNERDFTLEGRRDFTVSGYVVQMDQTPLAGIEVAITSAREGRRFEAQTGGAGNFEFHRVPPGVYRYTLSSGLVPRDDAGQVTVVDRDVSDVRLVAESGAEVYGEVSGFSDLGFVSVELVGADSAGSLPAEIDRQTASYRVAGVPAGRWRLEANEAGGGSASEIVVLEPGESKQVELSLEAGPLVFGTVHGESGPMPYSAVALRPVGIGRQEFVLADDQGRFEVSLPEWGTHRVAVFRNEGPELPVYEGVLEVRAGEDLDLYVTPIEVTGFVVSAETQRALAGAIVSISEPATDSELTLVTDETGTFRFTVAPRVELEVKASRPGSSGATTRYQARAQGEALRIELSPATRYD